MKASRLSPFVLVNLESGDTYIFQAPFFPPTIQKESKANWEAQDVSAGVKPLMYANREPLRISVSELWLDGSDDNSSVGGHIEQLQAMQQEGEFGTQHHGRPPRLRIVYGDYQKTVVLESLTVEETFFTREGKCIRAKLSLTLIEIQPASRPRRVNTTRPRFAEPR